MTIDMFNTNNDTEEEYMSLYEYLGKPAGSDLGKEVYIASVDSCIESRYRGVTSKNYQGAVRTYPKSWLDSYFKK